MSRESRLRSILKALTWRVIASGTTFMIAYFIFTGTGCEDVLEKSTIVALLESAFKIVIYYFHERAWQLAPEGSVRKLVEKN